MSPCYKIDEFVQMAHPRDGHQKLFAMIEAYLDESGIHSGASICVIAGYFAHAREWKKFEGDWRKVLSGQLVPMEKFHAKDLFKKTGFFHQWGKRTHEMFVNEILDTILRYKVFPVSSGILVEDFNSFSLEERRYLTGATFFHHHGKLVGGCPSKAYFVPFQRCVMKVADYTPTRGRAHFVFGLDRTFYRYANDLFRDMKIKAPLLWRKKLGSSTFPLAAETPELQAADVLTYLTYHHMTQHFHLEGWTDNPESELGYLLQRAKSASDFTCFNKACLQTALDELKLVLKELGRTAHPFDGRLNEKERGISDGI